MKRNKAHKIKKENPDGSLSQTREQEEHDLAYYIHDRVELMHQVFSILKYKEMKTMAPECIRNLAIGDLQELCTEELLGISSKRLLAILDGAEPPSDTESSSPSPPPDLETISLDSISSDEELLASGGSKKKKHKHHHRGSKSKSKKKQKSKEPEPQVEESAELSKASRAGLTVLELLELQARARAIRAQLQQEQVNKHVSAVESSHHSSDNDEIEIKEEPPDVVEISSEDEKPDVNKLNNSTGENTSCSKATETETIKETNAEQCSQSVTKRVSDLIKTVPQANPTRKIKLKRSKATVSLQNDSNIEPIQTRNVINETNSIAVATTSVLGVDKAKNTSQKTSDIKTKKKKKDKKKKTVEKDGSDHDEITLQLSDSEKMDLFEDLDESRKSYERVSSSSEDTENSSSDSEHDKTAPILPSLQETGSPSKSIIEEKLDIHKKNTEIIEEDKDQESNDNHGTSELLQSDSNLPQTEDVEHDPSDEINNIHKNIDSDKDILTERDNYDTALINDTNDLTTALSADTNENITETPSSEKNVTVPPKPNNNEKKLLHEHVGSFKSLNQDTSLGIDLIQDIPVLSDNTINKADNEYQTCTDQNEDKLNTDTENQTCTDKNEDKLNTDTENQTCSDKNADKLNTDTEKQEDLTEETEKHLSDGELSDRQSSEIEAIEICSEVVCLSDEEDTKHIKTNKKKKKKDKKSKKEKKNKKEKSDFREGADQNFYRDQYKLMDEELCNKKPIDLDSDDIYEILELSDDSSCYEVEGTVLSKEPTAQEIEALSAKIDEIERVDVVTGEQISKHDLMVEEKDTVEKPEEIMINESWKDRYLESNKVKKVLTTANIFNALRKKNKELKKKIEESKNKKSIEMTEEDNTSIVINIQLEEGSIEQYNTLQGSTKYADTAQDTLEKNKEVDDSKKEEDIASKEPVKENITKEMKKDAKQLLKMYKKLLKHNDMNKQSISKKKKKKKQKKQDNKIVNEKA